MCKTLLSLPQTPVWIQNIFIKANNVTMGGLSHFLNTRWSWQNDPCLNDSHDGKEIATHPSSSQSIVWSDKLCSQGGSWSPICILTIVLETRHFSFCSAVKVAYTSIKSYFFQISDGTVQVKPGSKYPLHEASWTKLMDLPPDDMKKLVTGTASEWT